MSALELCELGFMLGLSEVLMTRAVPISWRRGALAGCAATGRRAALQWLPVVIEAEDRLRVDPHLGAIEPRGDVPVGVGLRPHRDETANLEEQRACRSGEILAIGRYALDRLFTGGQDLPRFVHGKVRLGEVAKVAVQGAAELVHGGLSGSAISCPAHRS